MKLLLLNLFLLLGLNFLSPNGSVPALATEVENDQKVFESFFDLVLSSKQYQQGLGEDPSQYIDASKFKIDEIESAYRAFPRKIANFPNLVDARYALTDWRDGIKTLILKNHVMHRMSPLIAFDLLLRIQTWVSFKEIEALGEEAQTAWYWLDKRLFTSIRKTQNDIRSFGCSSDYS